MWYFNFFLIPSILRQIKKLRTHGFGNCVNGFIYVKSHQNEKLFDKWTFYFRAI